jgi:hypothetical protein
MSSQLSVSRVRVYCHIHRHLFHSKKPPVKCVTSLYYSTGSGENIGTSREVTTELSNLIMTVIVAYVRVKHVQIYEYVTNVQRYIRT